MAANIRNRGLVFSRSVGDVVHLIQVQKSTSSTAQQVRATVNLAVWVPALAPVRAGRRESPAVSTAHWQRRLGFLMPAHNDVWWSVSSPGEASAARASIAQAIQESGLPALDVINSTKALRGQWEAGISPGLTAKQRAYELQRLGKGEAI